MHLAAQALRQVLELDLASELQGNPALDEPGPKAAPARLLDRRPALLGPDQVQQELLLARRILERPLGWSVPQSCAARTCVGPRLFSVSASAAISCAFDAASTSSGGSRREGVDTASFIRARSCGAPRDYGICAIWQQ
ncbi:MAG: hypothetical protein ACJ8DP_16135 [Microvirga sp.]